MPRFTQLILITCLLTVVQVSLLKAQPGREKTISLMDSVNLLASENTGKAIAIMDSLILLYETKKDSFALGRALSLKAWFLMYQADYEQSLTLSHQSLAIQKKIADDPQGEGLTLNRIGLANLSVDRNEDALEYISKALKKFEEVKDTARIDMVLNNLGVLSGERGQYTKAITFYKRVSEIRARQGDSYWEAYALLNIGSTYIQTGQLDSANNYLRQAKTQFKKSGNPPPSHLYLSLARLNSELGKIDSSISYAQKAINLAIDEELPEIELNAQELLSELYSITQEFELAYSHLTRYQSLKNRLDSLANVTSIAEIEESYQNAEKEAMIAKLENEKLEAINDAQQSRLVSLYVFLVLIVTGTIVFIYFLRRNQKQKLKAAELQTKIASTRLVALKAQMNPHFIFNSLNTTQNFIMSSQKKEAYTYLAKFAKLLRLVLQSSNHSFIPLKDELTQLELYLKLESIRFADKFSYEIIIDQELKEAELEIPGMVIQPILENAILHGLVNQPEHAGQLELRLEYQKPQQVVCMVTDNGVGRKKASEIKQKKESIYQPVALPNVLERLEILTGHRASIKVEDLYDETEPTGTRVVVTLPARG